MIILKIIRQIRKAIKNLFFKIFENRKTSWKQTFILKNIKKLFLKIIFKNYFLKIVFESIL